MQTILDLTRISLPIRHCLPTNVSVYGLGGSISGWRPRRCCQTIATAPFQELSNQAVGAESQRRSPMTRDITITGLSLVLLPFTKILSFLWYLCLETPCLLGRQHCIVRGCQAFLPGSYMVWWFLRYPNRLCSMKRWDKDGTSLTRNCVSRTVCCHELSVHSTQCCNSRH